MRQGRCIDLVFEDNFHDILYNKCGMDRFLFRCKHCTRDIALPVQPKKRAKRKHLYRLNALLNQLELTMTSLIYVVYRPIGTSQTDLSNTCRYHLNTDYIQSIITHLHDSILHFYRLCASVISSSCMK